MAMILPTKRLSEQRSLLGMGALILRQLKAPKDVSRLWEDVKRAYLVSSHPNGSATEAMAEAAPRAQTFTYEWFVLALDFLFLVDAISVEDGRVKKLRQQSSARALREHEQEKEAATQEVYDAEQRTPLASEYYEKPEPKRIHLRR